MEFVVVIEKPTFFVLDTFSARSGEPQHDKEFPEQSAQHQMKIRKELWHLWYTGHTDRTRRSHCKEGSPLPGKVC